MARRKGKNYKKKGGKGGPSPMPGVETDDHLSLRGAMPNAGCLISKVKRKKFRFFANFTIETRHIMQNIIQELREELKGNSDPQTHDSAKHFFKEEIRLYGVNTALVSKIGKAYFKRISHLNKNEIYNHCDQLWQSGYMEETFIAAHWSNAIRKKFEPSDFVIFEEWISRYISNWASCDTFCNHTMGEFIMMYPVYLAELKRMTKSDNRWVKRAAAVSLIIPAKRGMFLPDVFEIAELMLTDKDDMVQKGYGWMLKVASQAHPKEVFDFVLRHKSVMPRTALRYAIEKMPPDWKVEAMKK